VLDERDAVRYMYTSKLAGSCWGLMLELLDEIPAASFASIPTCLERDKTV
jgi:hypothetical protein